MGCVALHGRDGCGRVDDCKDLRVYLDVEILLLRHSLVAGLDGATDEVREVPADDAEAHVDDPLYRHHIKVKQVKKSG